MEIRTLPTGYCVITIFPEDVEDGSSLTVECGGPIIITASTDYLSDELNPDITINGKPERRDNVILFPTGKR